MNRMAYMSSPLPPPSFRCTDCGSNIELDKLIPGHEEIMDQLEHYYCAPCMKNMKNAYEEV